MFTGDRVRAVDQSWILPKTLFRPFCFLLVVGIFKGNSSKWKLSRENPFMKSTEREGLVQTLWRVKWFFVQIRFAERLSVVCIEDAFETYLPASMIPSENVIRLENGISKSRICRFHKSVNCLSESSQIQTETWLFVWLLENANICVNLISDLYLTY